MYKVKSVDGGDIRILHRNLLLPLGVQLKPVDNEDSSDSDSDLDEKAMPDVGIILSRSTEHPSAGDVANEAFVDEAGKGESDSIIDREPCVQMDEVLPEENDLLDPGTLVSDSQYKLGSGEELRDSLHESIDSLDQPLLEQENGGDVDAGNESSEISDVQAESDLVEDSVEAGVASNPESLIGTKEFLEFIDGNTGVSDSSNSNDSSFTGEKASASQERDSQADQLVSDPESELEAESEEPIVPRRSSRSNKGAPLRFGEVYTHVVWV